MSELDTLFDAATAAPEMVVTLLGTGTVLPEPDRFGPATLVQAGSQTLLFDFGRGASIRLGQIGVHPSNVTANFLTHFHSDHVVGLPDIWLTATVHSIDGSGIGRKWPMRLIGPKGTAKLTAGLTEAFAADIAMRCACDGTPAGAADFSVSEFEQDGIVHEEGDVTVTAFEVDHHELIKPAYGFRIDYRGLSVLLSGDTRYCPNVAEHGRRVDLIVHEVMMAHEAAILAPRSRVPGVLTHHISPTAAGTLFTEIGPKLAVYTHIILPGGGGRPGPTVAELEAETRKTYAGPLVVGSDLDRFIIRRGGVETQHFDLSGAGYSAPASSGQATA